jgi:hypothetical protein
MNSRAGLTIVPCGFALLLAVLSPLPAPAQAASPAQATAPRVDLGGMLSALATSRLDAAFEPLFNVRFIPEVKFSLALGRGTTLDAEASVDAYASAALLAGAPADTSADVKPYRGWLRLSTSRFEARVGLQKLSFGPAALFRPLMWFDSLDPRDPLQLTSGVYGLLLRYFTKGNANVWAWGLLGNEDARGWDLAPPDRKTPEFGGRVQVPLFKGELAATYHRRKAAIDGLVPVMGPPPASPLPVPPVPEDRFGLDGKWDLGVGVWFEGALVHQRTPFLPSSYQRALTLGLDYTFGLGRGLTVMAEQFRLAAAARAFGRGDGRSFTALLMRYPLGLSDEVSGIFYYDGTTHDLYRFLSWKRTTDALSFNVILFWNPADPLVIQGRPGSASFAGTGFELLLAYYF